MSDSSSDTTASTASTAVIMLAAGAGTRMKSSTPKMLHEVAGRSMLGHALHAAAGLDPHYLVAVVGHGRDKVVPAIEELTPSLPHKPTVLIAVQEEQNGTGHAVDIGLTALPKEFSGTVVVTTSDVPALNANTLKQLVQTHDAKPHAAVTVLTTAVEDPHGYGRIIRDQDGNVTEIVEEKDASESQKTVTEVNSAVYAFDAEFLRASLNKLDTNNAQGELYLTDVIRIARSSGELVRAHKLADDYLVSGVNDRVQLARMNKEFNRRICEQAMRNGATIVDPGTTFIDCTVTIGQDVTIHPGTQLKGTTTIADGAEIGPDSTLTNVIVGENAVVVRTHAFDSEIGSGANVGPFTYLRPGTILGEGGKLGGFVESKNARVGRGSKVPHLTYIGDAEVGEYSNIGCSSVFVNYDGVNKHKSVVGDHVRLGSDSMIVAPVTIGDGAYSGAGTVIKDDVPAGALVVSGGKQRNIEGWVERKRPGTPAAEAAAAARKPKKV